MNPNAFDYAALAVLVAWSIFDWRWYWPRYVRAIRANVPGARMRMYRNLAVAEWIVTLYVLGLWVAKARPWSALWLTPPGYVRSGFGLALVIAVIGLLMTQTKQILAQPKAMAKVREKMGPMEQLVPRTESERHTFWFVSITAGICEEILFRGFVLWLFTAWTGLIAAVILSSILFGFGHIYQGPSRVPITSLVGFVLAIIVVATGSLWPAIVIHAALDWNSGELGFRVLREPESPSEPLPSPMS